MRIIVVGAGKVGTALCRSLVEEKHDVILIEEKEEVLKRLSKRYDVMGFAGNGANFKILEQAEVSNCDVFIAMTDKDEVNMISAVKVDSSFQTGMLPCKLGIRFMSLVNVLIWHFSTVTSSQKASKNFC